LLYEFGRRLYKLSYPPKEFAEITQISNKHELIENPSGI